MGAMIRDTGLSRVEVARRIGINARTLRRYLNGGAQLPLIVMKAIEAVRAEEAVPVTTIRHLIEGTPTGRQVATGKLRALHPSLAKPVPVKAPKPLRKRKVKAKPVKVKLPGRRGRGYGAARILPPVPEGPAERHARVIASLRPDRRADDLNRAMLRAALATPEEPEPQPDDEPKRGPGFITRLI
jgi:Helix-turn-helix